MGDWEVKYEPAKRKETPRITAKFKRMAELYRHFSEPWKEVLDYSDEALLELFLSESYGGKTSPKNGFGVGKSWLNVTVQMWLDDRSRGHLVLSEIYQDNKYPHWWLDSIFKISRTAS